MDNSPNPNPNFSSTPITAPSPNPVSTMTPSPDQPVQQSISPSIKPVKKKNFLAIILLTIGGVVAAVVAIIICVIMSKIDYGSSYRAAKKLNSVASSLNSDACTSIVSHVDNKRIGNVTYNSHVTSCVASVANINKYTDELSETDAIKKDKEIKAQFERFMEIKNSTVPSDEEFDTKAKLYMAYHNFIFYSEYIDAKSVSDADLKHAADFLINSGNDILKAYGEGWLEKITAYVHAHQTYYNTRGNANYNQLLQNRNDAKDEFDTWVTANRPNIPALFNLDFSNAKQLSSEFRKLYDLITESYEQNYDPDSGDCHELLDEVICS